MIFTSRTLSRAFRLLAPVVSTLLTALPDLHAHRPFEVTSVGRLQHGRLEFTVTISLVMANFLLRDPAKGEAPIIDAGNFEAHREALLRLAPDFYTVSDGPTPLRPGKVLLAINSSGEPEFQFIYPRPAVGPLRIRVSGLHAPGAEGRNLVCVYNDDETLLGGGLLGPTPSSPELSVPLSDPATAMTKH